MLEHVRQVRRHRCKLHWLKVGPAEDAGAWGVDFEFGSPQASKVLRGFVTACWPLMHLCHFPLCLGIPGKLSRSVGQKRGMLAEVQHGLPSRANVQGFKTQDISRFCPCEDIRSDAPDVGMEP